MKELETIQEEEYINFSKAQLNKLLSISISLLITNLVFMFSLFIVVTNRITEGISFSSTPTSILISLFSLLSTISLVLFTTAIYNATSKLNFTEHNKKSIQLNLGKQLRKVQVLALSGIIVTGVSCILCLLFTALTFR